MSLHVLISVLLLLCAVFGSLLLHFSVFCCTLVCPFIVYYPFSLFTFCFLLCCPFVAIYAFFCNVVLLYFLRFYFDACLLVAGGTPDVSDQF